MRSINPKPFYKRSLSLILAYSLAFMPAISQAQNAPTGPQDRTPNVSPNSEPDINVIRQPVTLENGEQGEIVLETRSSDNEVEFRKARSWYIQIRQTVNSDAPEYAVQLEGQAFKPEAVSDYSQIEKIEIPLNRFESLKNYLTEALEKAREPRIVRVEPKTPGLIKASIDRLKNFIFSSEKRYNRTFGVIRFATVGFVVSKGFLQSNLPPEAAIAAGATLGLISGLISWNVDWYTEILVKKGFVAKGFAAALGKLTQIEGETSQDSKSRILKNGFFRLSSEMTKWMAIEAVILAIADVIFRSFGVPMHETFGSAASAILITSALATAGQGTWDVAISRIKDADVAAADSNTRKVLDIKALTAMKVLAIALGTNFGSALSMSNIEEVKGLGQAILYGFTATGGPYLLYALLRDHPRAKKMLATSGRIIKKACSELLSDVSSTHSSSGTE